METPEPREPSTGAWYRELQDGRLEIHCRAPGHRLRVSAPEAEAWEAVELFESWTGLEIVADRRPPRRKAPPIAGQLSMYDLLDPYGLQNPDHLDPDESTVRKSWEESQRRDLSSPEAVTAQLESER